MGIALAYIFKDNRAFCKHVCPITVFLKPMSYYSLLRVHCDENKCVHCGKCLPDYSVIQQLCAVLHVSLVELLDGRNGIKGYDEQTMIALLHRTQELAKQKIILYGLVLIVLGIAGGALANTTGGSDIQSFVSGLLKSLSVVEILSGIFMKGKQVLF